MKRLSLFIRSSIPVIAIVLIVIEVIVANQLTSLQRSVNTLEKSIISIEGENEVLSQEVASSSALTTIYDKAKRLGFRKSVASDYFHIGIESVALRLSPRLDGALFAGSSAVPQ